MFTCSKNDAITSTICAKWGHSLAYLFQDIIMSLYLQIINLTTIIFELSQSEYLSIIHFAIHSFNIKSYIYWYYLMFDEFINTFIYWSIHSFVHPFNIQSSWTVLWFIQSSPSRYKLENLLVYSTRIWFITKCHNLPQKYSIRPSQ